MNKQLDVPQFNTEDEERTFWDTLDTTQYFAPEDFTRAAFPDLKPTTRAISIRLPEWLLARLKERGNEEAVPYQSLIKRYLIKGVESEHAA